MSTSALITIKEGTEKLHFYRHSDGDPTTTLPSLNKFLDRVKSHELRTCLSQTAGHLIVQGYLEYKEAGILDAPGYSFKVGAYEPIPNTKYCVEYKYVVDLLAKTIKHKAVTYTHHMRNIPNPEYHIQQKEKDVMSWEDFSGPIFVESAAKNYLAHYNTIYPKTDFRLVVRKVTETLVD